MHVMGTEVNARVVRRRQTARTETAVLAAASRLFLARGYPETTLADVAAEADVALRTIYVRFGTKAELFKRVVDVGIVGDTEAVDVPGRDWMHDALHAQTRARRISAAAAARRAIMARTGALFAVAVQAAAIEPAVAVQWEQGRAQGREGQRVFWTTMAADGLLPAGRDLPSLIDSASVVGTAETYLLGSRMLGWDLDAYESWLRDTWARLAC